jgi:hypothetical protein
MATQKFMGQGEIIKRLAEQMRTQKSPPKDPHAAAIAVLQARGHLKADGKTFTAAGAARNQMTAEERAKDRAARATGASPSSFTYNPRTNRARRK